MQCRMVVVVVVDVVVTICCIGVGTGGALGACAPPIFWVTNTNIIQCPPTPQSDKIDCRLLEGIKVLFKRPLKVS